MKRVLYLTLAGTAVIVVWLFAACTSSDQQAEDNAEFKQTKAELMGELQSAIDTVDNRIAALRSKTGEMTDTLSGGMQSAADTMSANVAQELEEQRESLTRLLGEIQGATLASIDSLQADANSLIGETERMLHVGDTTDVMDTVQTN